MARGADLEQQVLATVGELIYREGINATGVDRLSEVAGVSKRTLYQHFHSKDELVGRSLAASDEAIADALLAAGEAARAAGARGRDQIVAVFRSLGDRSASDEFRGCPFVNAAVELVDREHPAQQAVRAHKERVRAWFQQAAEADRLPDPAALSRRLMLVLDGFFVESLLRADDDLTTDTVAIVEALLGRRGRPASRP